MYIDQDTSPYNFIAIHIYIRMYCTVLPQLLKTSDISHANECQHLTARIGPATSCMCLHVGQSPTYSKFTYTHIIIYTNTITCVSEWGMICVLQASWLRKWKLQGSPKSIKKNKNCQQLVTAYKVRRNAITSSTYIECMCTIYCGCVKYIHT